VLNARGLRGVHTCMRGSCAAHNGEAPNASRNRVAVLGVSCCGKTSALAPSPHLALHASAQASITRMHRMSALWNVGMEIHTAQALTSDHARIMCIHHRYVQKDVLCVAVTSKASKQEPLPVASYMALASAIVQHLIGCSFGACESATPLA
jgi:hypothetical protein